MSPRAQFNASHFAIKSIAEGSQERFLSRRGRPSALLTHVTVRGGLVTGNGYPSGHTAVAFALATVVALWFGARSRCARLALAAAAVVGFARLYVGAHFPLDVVGGAALGTICGAIAALVLRRGHSVAG